MGQLQIVSYAVIVLVCGALVMLVSGCNTMAGFGRDLEQGGRAITHSAERTGARMEYQMGTAEAEDLMW